MCDNRSTCSSSEAASSAKVQCVTSQAATPRPQGNQQQLDQSCSVVGMEAALEKEQAGSIYASPRELLSEEGETPVHMNMVFAKTQNSEIWNRTN